MPDSVEENREAALERAIAQIERSFGKGAIMRLDDHPTVVSGISTGALSLDLALGGSGVPRGRVIEVFGPESSGKTTLTLHIIAEAQKKGGAAAFIDVEHAFDPSWGKRLGVNLESLMVNQPSCGEEALDICELLVRSNALDVIVIDSVAALVPRQELEGQMGDASVGVQARLMSQAMRKLTGISSKSRTAIIFINQIREKIGVMYGSPETTTGGRALKFYSSVRIDTRRIGMLKDGDQVIGSRVRAKVVKNKVAPPFREAEFDIMFDGGISSEGDILDLASNCGVINRSGTWYSYGETKLGQGKENSKQFFQDNPDLLDEIREKVIAIKLPHLAEQAGAKPGGSDNGPAAKPQSEKSQAEIPQSDKLPSAKTQPEGKEAPPAKAGAGPAKSKGGRKK